MKNLRELSVAIVLTVAGCGGGGGQGASGGTGGGTAGTGSGGTTGAAGGGTAGTIGTPGAAGSSGEAGATAGAAGGPGGVGGGSGTSGAAGMGVSGGGAGTGGASSGGRGGGNAGRGGATGAGGVAGSTGGAGTGGAAGAGGAAGLLAPTSLAVRFANAVMTRWPDPNSITTPSAWEYNHGIVLRGMEQVYRHTRDARYLTYIRRYADTFVSEAGVVSMPAQHSFDNIQPAVLLPFLFQETGAAKYRTASESIRALYDSIPRNADRGYWHKQTYPNQMWLDGIYMGMPFLMRYGAAFGNCGSFCNDTVAEQALLLAAHVSDNATGLLYHAWDGSPSGMKAAWANATTGRSPIVWGRALGWYAMALVDMLPDLPANHPRRAEMLSILMGIATALQNTQDAATGLWYQVVDMGTRSDNWLESSASGMFVYALKIAVNRGYIPSTFLTVANKGWTGLQTKVTNDAMGLPSFTGAVHGMGVQVDYASYLNQLPLLTNSSHGLCAILLAAAEMEAP